MRSKAGDRFSSSPFRLLTINRSLLALCLALLLTFAGQSLAAERDPFAGGDAISADSDIASGDWLALSVKYPNLASKTVSEDRTPLTADALASWWNVLSDDTLTGLIRTALYNSRTIEAARSKVRQSRASLGIASAALLPLINNADKWTKSSASDNSVNNGAEAEIMSLGIDASWEIDLFGRLRDKERAAFANLEAEVAALYGTWITLTGDIALNYVTLRSLQERFAIAERNLANQEETTALLLSRYKAGLIDSLALNQSISLRERTRAAIPTLRANIEITMNALATLTGAIPGSLEELLGIRKPLPQAQNVSLAGIPAEAMRQRPDVRAAERRFAAQVSTRKSAEKDLLPKFSLLGSIGLEALEGNALFSSSSVGFTFGPQITLPIFNGGAIRRNIEVQTEAENQLLAAYEQTVLQAAAEVRGAVASCAQEKLRNRLLRTGTEAVNNTLVSARDRYKSGLTSFSDVMQAQGSLLEMEDQLAQSDAQMTANLIKLFKALGGGWTPIANDMWAASADIGAR